MRYKTMTKDELLEMFQYYASGVHTQAEANSLWLRLRGHLTGEQRADLSIAWGHVGVRGNRQKLSSACDDIRKCWSCEV